MVKVTGQENEKTGFLVLLGLCMLFFVFWGWEICLGAMDCWICMINLRMTILQLFVTNI